MICNAKGHWKMFYTLKEVPATSNSFFDWVKDGSEGYRFSLQTRFELVGDAIDITLCFAQALTVITR
jgi:hypothetical protein